MDKYHFFIAICLANPYLTAAWTQS